MHFLFCRLHDGSLSATLDIVSRWLTLWRESKFNGSNSNSNNAASLMISSNSQADGVFFELELASTSGQAHHNYLRQSFAKA
jgi:hypothetical protein